MFSLLNKFKNNQPQQRQPRQGGINIFGYISDIMNDANVVMSNIFSVTRVMSKVFLNVTKFPCNVSTSLNNFLCKDNDPKYRQICTLSSNVTNQICNWNSMGILEKSKILKRLNNTPDFNPQIAQNGLQQLQNIIGNVSGKANEYLQNLQQTTTTTTPIKEKSEEAETGETKEEDTKEETKEEETKEENEKETKQTIKPTLIKEGEGQTKQTIKPTLIKEGELKPEVKEENNSNFLTNLENKGKNLFNNMNTSDIGNEVKSGLSNIFSSKNKGNLLSNLESRASSSLGKLGSSFGSRSRSSLGKLGSRFGKLGRSSFRRKRGGSNNTKKMTKLEISFVVIEDFIRNNRHPCFYEEKNYDYFANLFLQKIRNKLFEIKNENETDDNGVPFVNYTYIICQKKNESNTRCLIGFPDNEHFINIVLDDIIIDNNLFEDINITYDLFKPEWKKQNETRDEQNKVSFDDWLKSIIRLNYTKQSVQESYIENCEYKDFMTVSQFNRHRKFSYDLFTTHNSNGNILPGLLYPGSNPNNDYDDIINLFQNNVNTSKGRISDLKIEQGKILRNKFKLETKINDLIRIRDRIKDLESEIEQENDSINHIKNIKKEYNESLQNPNKPYIFWKECASKFELTLQQAVSTGPRNIDNRPSWMTGQTQVEEVVENVEDDVDDIIPDVPSLPPELIRQDAYIEPDETPEDDGEDEGLSLEDLQRRFAELSS